MKLEKNNTEIVNYIVHIGSVLGFDKLWQMPAKTEKHAFDLVLTKKWSFESTLYIGFPWANLIDGLDRQTDVGVILKKALDNLTVDKSHKRIITVCQHIKFRNHMELFKQIGVTDIFASHALVSERVCAGINIHPFPLFPVQAVEGASSDVPEYDPLEEFNNRKYRYSFIGAFNPKYYLTNSRELLFNLPQDSNSYILGRNYWHFENKVYNQQIHGNQQTTEDKTKETKHAKEYIEVLKDTRFSPCPSGTGPNSIRLWESLEFGCIPVILADDLRLPGRQELWDAGCISLNENKKDINRIPNLLEEYENNQAVLSEKLTAISHLRLLYGQDGFITDIENLVADIEEENLLVLKAKSSLIQTIYLEVGRLNVEAIISWIYYLNLISLHLEVFTVVYIDQDTLMGLDSYTELFPYVTIKTRAHGFDQCHNWSENGLVNISDSAVLSTQLIRRYSHILISAQAKPKLVNPSLFDDIYLLLQAPARTLNKQAQLFSAFVRRDLLCDLEEWQPICSVLTSMYNGDEYVEGFLENASKFSKYDEVEHFIIRPNSPGQEHSIIQTHIKVFGNAIYIWLNKDPGLYEVWNECSKLSSARYLTNANIDDRRDSEHISNLTSILDNNCNVDVASSALRVTDTKNLSWEESADCTVWYSNEHKETYAAERLSKSKGGSLIAYNVPHCMPVWRKFLHLMNGYFNEAEFGPSSDWEFWLRCGQQGSRFYILGQPLGLYLRAADSYWRRTENASDFDRRIVALYFDSNQVYKSEIQPVILARRIAEMLALKQQQSDLGFLFSFYQLLKNSENSSFTGESFDQIIEPIGVTTLGINRIRNLVRSLPTTFNRSGENRAVTEFFMFLVSCVHVMREVNPIERGGGTMLIYRVCTELSITTHCIEPLLIKAFLAHIEGDNAREEYFINRAYTNFPETFWSQIQSVYRFTCSLKKISTHIDDLAPFGGLFGLKQGQKLFFFPDYSHGNPYQSLLYEAIESFGIKTFGFSDLEDLDGGKFSFNRGDICHIHWINIVFKNVDEGKLEETIDKFLWKIDSLKKKGMKIYWTVHNQYSHDFSNQLLEKSFRERLYNLADIVFIHHPMLLAKLEEWLPDIKKIQYIEHGNYIDRYANEISSEEARSALGLNIDDLVISVLGQIRPYKDLHKLLPQLRKSMLKNPRLKLVVAGRINCKMTLAELAKIPSGQVVIKNEFIADNEIQKYIKAASFALLSYRAILTSGSLFQAFSFGVPVIAPAMGSIPAYVVDGWNGFLYRNPNELEKILSGLDHINPKITSEMKRHATKTAKSLSWV